MRLVKRVIGLPGETLEVRDRDVYIDGTEARRTLRGSSRSPRTFDRRDNFGPCSIPPDHFFMMGDNRDNSNDSRFWGFAPRDSLIGKPLFIYWSYEDEPYSQELTAAQWIETLRIRRRALLYPNPLAAHRHRPEIGSWARGPGWRSWLRPASTQPGSAANFHRPENGSVVNFGR